ncbi:hypothetical protein F5Y14DRAFT_236198 [Nemania sp. NC0429]|nr:hypothetical protein F5Y14DRAFT_236198 [Nemania sp. NC0429]
MCIEVYNLFGDADCRHKEYQNTFPCHVARRCHPGDDQLLREPVFLPARRPNVPPGLLGCKVRKATRPMTGKCRRCSSRNNSNNSNNDDNMVTGTLARTSTLSTESATHTSKSIQNQNTSTIRKKRGICLTCFPQRTDSPRHPQTVGRWRRYESLSCNCQSNSESRPRVWDHHKEEHVVREVESWLRSGVALELRLPDHHKVGKVWQRR